MADDPRNWQWKCSSDEIYADCGSDPATGKVTNCNFKEFVGTEERVCTPPDRYRDKDGNYHFDGETGGRLVLPPSEEQPKNEKQPEEKRPKNEIAPKGMCYYFGGTYAKSKQEVCSRYGGGWTWGANGCTTSVHKEGFGIMPSLVQCPKGFEQDEQPKTPKNPPVDDKQPNDGNSGKGGKGEGSGSGDGNGKGEGSGDGNGKGEGKGEGDGKGDAEGKGMFKGGAGSGHISEVRVPKSRDGLGWRGDFFLRNPNQCPQDKTMSVLGRQVVFSYAKICQYLDMLAPVVKAVFMFVAGLMVVKSIRAK